MIFVILQSLLYRPWGVSWLIHWEVWHLVCWRHPLHLDHRSEWRYISIYIIRHSLGRPPFGGGTEADILARVTAGKVRFWHDSYYSILSTLWHFRVMVVSIMLLYSLCYSCYSIHNGISLRYLYALWTISPLLLSSWYCSLSIPLGQYSMPVKVNGKPNVWKIWSDICSCSYLQWDILLNRYDWRLSNHSKTMPCPSVLIMNSLPKCPNPLNSQSNSLFLNPPLTTWYTSSELGQ